MYVCPIKYTDYLGVEREEDFHFNLSKAELMRMEMSEYGGMEALLQRIVKEQDTKRIYEMFEKIITSAYGIISQDGVSFDKDETMLKRFMNSEAYSNLIMHMIEDPDFANEFIRGCFPKDIQEKVAKEGGKVTEIPKANNNPIPAPPIK